MTNKITQFLDLYKAIEFGIPPLLDDMREHLWCYNPSLDGELSWLGKDGKLYSVDYVIDYADKIDDYFICNVDQGTGFTTTMFFLKSNRRDSLDEE